MVEVQKLVDAKWKKISERQTKQRLAPAGLLPASVKNTLLLGEPLPYNPSAETANPAPDLVLRKPSFLIGVFSRGVLLFTDTGRFSVAMATA